MTKHLVLLVAMALLHGIGCDDPKKVSHDAGGDSGVEQAAQADAGARVATEKGAIPAHDQWVRHVSQVGKWSAAFPEAPSTQPTQMRFQADRLDAQETAWVSDDKTEVFAVRWYERPSKQPPTPKELVRLVESFVAEMGLPNATTKQARIGGLPAVDVLGKTRTGRILAGRVFVTRAAFVQIFAVTAQPKSAEHFVTTLEYRVPQAGKITYQLDSCGVSIALPSKPTHSALDFEVAGQKVVATHYISNAPKQGLAFGMVCYDLTEALELEVSPRRLVEAPLNQLAKTTGGTVIEQETKKREQQVVATRALEIQAGEGPGRIEARSEVSGDRVVVRYVSATTPKGLDSPAVRAFMQVD